MKELTPSGWVGVLIGIVVFGSLVGHVAASQPKKCWKKLTSATRLENVNDLSKAFDLSKWTEECEGSDLCLQYYPKNLALGHVKAHMQCGASCSTTGLTSLVIMGGGANDYECHACTSSSTSNDCKDLVTATKGKSKCYSYSVKDKAAVSDIKSVPQIFCLDNCQGATRNDGKVFVGCANDCESNKGGGSCANCANQDCEKLIFKPPMCYKKTVDQKLETVKLITEAYDTSQWKENCDYNQVCLQYYPEANKATGKVSLLVECGTTCGTKTGYKCHQCDSRDSGNCKKITDVTTGTGVNECYDFDNEKNTGDSALIPKIYCFDACQFKETGSKVTVNCAAIVVTGTNCPPSDLLCAKKIFKTNDVALTDGTVTPPGGNQATTATTRPKTSNKLTISKYLLGSLAIQLFATNQYIRQF